MAGLTAAAAIISIVVSAIGGIAETYSLISQSAGNVLARKIANIAQRVQKAIKSDKNYANTLFALVNSKNLNALQNFLTSNPANGINVTELQEIGKQLAGLQSQLNDAYTDMQNELNALSLQSGTGGFAAIDKSNKVDSEGDEIIKKYKEKTKTITDQIQALDEKQSNYGKSYTERINARGSADLKAIDQNTNGGLINNGLQKI